MNTLITLLKKHLMKLIVVLMLIWTVTNIFVTSQIYASGMFCAVGVPTVQAALGKKYAIPLAVVGVVWLVISIIMEMRN